MPCPGRKSPRRVPLLAACRGFLAAVLLLGARIVLAEPAILRHDLSVALHPESHTLTATDTMEIRPDGDSRISLSLAKGADVSRLSVGGKDYPLIPSPFREGMLGFAVPEEARQGTLEVAVAYGATFNDPVPDASVVTENPGYGVSGSISSRGVFLNEDAGWYPDLPGSTPTWRVRVETGEGIEAVTAGKRIRRSAAGGVTVSEWEIGQPTPGIALSAGAYNVRERNEGDIKLYTYFYPESEPLADNYLMAAAGFLEHYRNLFGPYPFDKFAVVENFFPTGYGFPSYTLLGSTVLRLPFIVETSLGHEIAHSWWGNGVRVDPRGGNWSEGLVTYVADHLYQERASPAAGRAYRLNLLRDYATLVPPELDFPLKEFTARASPASQAVGYGKAAMVFHMARRQAGNEAFREGLRALAQEKLFRTASWDDFDRTIFRGIKLEGSSFFRPWVDRPGAPVLALKDVKAEKDDGRWKVTGRLVQEKPHYELRVPLRLETDGKPVDAVLPVFLGETPFVLIADSRPSRLVVDPEVDVFRRLDPSEIPPLINAVRGSGSLLAVAARGLRPEILEASGILLSSLGKEDSRVVREEDTPLSALAGHDVLYLGLPLGSGYLPPLPRELSITPDRFTLEGVTYAGPGDALFAVLPHPSDKGRTAAVFLPLSAGAASLAGRKIPHYGKYSFLSFSGGVNKGKGTWAVTASPVIHVFSP
jgi:aminopeptidase N